MHSQKSQQKDKQEGELGSPGDLQVGENVQRQAEDLHITSQSWLQEGYESRT